MTDRKCSIDGCNKKLLAKGYCGMHYGRNRRGVDLEALGREYHGMSKTPIYNVWCLMNKRCHDKSSDDWRYYGGRGIAVCKEWRNSFISFYKSMGSIPKDQTIERIDNNKGYEPGNCKWATRLEQANNQRIKSSNNTGISGVGWSRCAMKWRARISYNNVSMSLGVFTDFFEACCSRKSAENRIKQTGILI